MNQSREAWREIVDGRWFWTALVAVLAVVASITGLQNGFSYDDVHVIVKNPALHTLDEIWNLFLVSYWRPEYGSFLYRPLTSIAFALQWAAADGSPFPFHLVSIGLYAACAAALYHLALAIVPRRAAIAAALVFAVHPIHVEAVANVAGQAELWVALILIVVADYYIRLRQTRMPDMRDTAFIAVAYLVACCFKEHAIVLPGLLAAAELTVVKDRRQGIARVRHFLPLVAAMVVVAGAFILIRQTILLGVADDSTSPLLRGEGFGTRFFTMLSVVMEWVRLFVWPADLSADYSFSRLRTYDSFSPVMIPGLMALAGAVWLAIVVRRSNPGFSFGISWVGLALLIPSNLVVVTGFVLAERTLFLASVGVAVCIGVGLHEALKLAERSRASTRHLVMGVMFIALGAAITRSMTRSPVWGDNETLFRQTIEDAPSSGRAHWMLAAQLFETKRLPEALEEMELAVVLGGKKDAFMLGYAGDLFATSGRCQRAITFYLQALELTPGDIRVRVNTSRCLIQLHRPDEAKAVALSGGDAISRDARIRNVALAADSLQSAGGPQ